MSDSGGDIDDELLELAGAGAGAAHKKRKRRQPAPSSSSKSKTSKKRRAETDSDAESPESEEDGDGSEANPYPLEGKYINEADRQRLMKMSEIDREDILAQRLEEMQRILDKRSVDQMLKEQNQSNHNHADGDSVSKAAKRQHAVRGATKEKSRKLDELKARRKAKDDKKRTRANSPKRDRSSSPMDMEISSEEDEDGLISKLEQQEEREDKKLNGLLGKSTLDEDDGPITVEDLNKCRLSRDSLAKHCLAPWFEDYCKGAWVRYLIGQESGQPVYRICEISNLGPEFVKPYKINDKTVNQVLELKHGKSVRLFSMDKVSNSPFHPKEFERLEKVCTMEDVKLPSKRHLEQKKAQLAKLISQPMTESDISAMLLRKTQMQANKHSAGWMTLEKSRLTQARTLAIRRQDDAEVALINEQLKELAESISASGNIARDEGDTDMLAKVNERNRKANIEAVRKAEIAETERKRRERKIAAAGGVINHDPSARLKTLPRTFNAATPSRPGTPNFGSTPPLSTPLPPSALSGTPSSSKTKTFETSVIDSIEVDLGDF